MSIDLKRIGFAAAATAAMAFLSSCAFGVKGTPGMKIYSKGAVAEAIPLLQSEVTAGEISARYLLGNACRLILAVAARAASQKHWWARHQACIQSHGGQG